MSDPALESVLARACETSRTACETSRTASRTARSVHASCASTHADMPVLMRTFDVRYWNSGSGAVATPKLELNGLK
jgi:hypothetical protein